MYILLVLIIAVVPFFVYRRFTNGAQFGKEPTGDRLSRVRQSPNYGDGAFKNLSHTPQLTGGSMPTVMWEFFVKRSKRNKPKDRLPSEKNDLNNIPIGDDVLVWFGHSSYYMQVDGKRMLVDPVFCGHASPVSFSTRAFAGADDYNAEDMPELDYLFLTHDHWDHLDYDTVTKLMPKVKIVICALGVGAHLEYWGYDPAKIIELDWNEETTLPDGFSIHATSARHFSGRWLKRNQTIWTAFVLQTPTMRIFIGGDGGYDTHYKEIGERFGNFDLAILENGQYNKYWKHIHFLPGESLQAAQDLNAQRLLSVHNSKFALSLHAWDEPLILISEQCKDSGMPLLTPKIGEIVYLKNKEQVFTEWWKGVK